MDSKAIRDELVVQLRKDLIGPHEDDEQLIDRPTVQYLTGILYPSGQKIELEEDEELSIEQDFNELDEDEEVDTIPTSDTMNPSSIGLTFALKNGMEEVNVIVCYGLYEQQEDKTWHRKSVQERTAIKIQTGKFTYSLPGGAKLEWVVRPQSPVNVTVFLVNRNTISSDGRIDDAQCIFQPEITVFSEEYPFIHRAAQNSLPADSDIESANLLYRDVMNFAVGHSCSVTWEKGNTQNSHAKELKTVLIPYFELPAITPADVSALTENMKMQLLAEARKPQDLIELLQPLLDAYQSWIDRKTVEIGSLKEEYQATAKTHIELCREALARMQNGLELLNQTRVFEAFQFANRAMLLQRIYGERSKEYRQSGVFPKNVFSKDNHKWRPFQMAFILLNLPSLVNKQSDDRGLVDLLWFPTGGGKTEAYLGLAAFVMGLRRLQGTIDGRAGDGGVTVIMRYTLRLLTTQQFQRAAILICACEYLRRRDKKWGKTPFQIGLWVGAGATPNVVSGDGGAAEILDRIKKGETVAEGNPMQLPFCPWCGEELKARNYHIDSALDRLIVACGRKECEFYGKPKNLEKALPVILVDENIYQQCPSLLIATADKFARIPWKPQTMALFGQVNRHCARHGYLTRADDHPTTHRINGSYQAVQVQNCLPFLPPELIIQDELHLISGPLGTLAGLYETVIDRLCSYTKDNGVVIRPKIIASTATIRRANEQIKSLFARDVRLFPPSGLTAGDSFFAEVQSTDVQPGRGYLGIFAPGRSVKTALVRVYATLLQSAGEYFATDKENADPYMTLVGYFNSLRELGGALRLVEDDIIQRLEYLSNSHITPARQIKRENLELTSRIPSYKIPEILALLEKKASEPESLDVLLATNMISVGVDVDRLGLMVINGQPKASAEYIQASSRVGRQKDKPGLVVTVYNWSRPRDTSHYEQFQSYHEPIYRHVEATSVTPFAPRARDKALHAVVIALARLLENAWTRDKDASRIDPNHNTITTVIREVIARVKKIDPSLVDEVSDQLQIIMEWWQRQANQHGSALQYNGNTMYPDSKVPVLMHPAEKQMTGGSRATLNSLREVEPESTVYIEWED